MKIKLKILLFLTLAVAVVVLNSTKTDSKPVQKIQNSNAPVAASESKFQSQKNLEGSVEVTVTPKNVSVDKKTWNFKIVLDTHEGSLDQDLTKNAVLKSSEGEELLPLTWQGSPPGGHHREGLLNFIPLSKSPKSIILILQNIGEVEERRFVYE